MSRLPIAIIGGGLTGLTCALKLAEHGKEVHLFEAAPELGGRTRSFYDKQINSWVDNGPHLLIGAYEATQRLLSDVGAAGHVTWQSSLKLPLWDHPRGFFSLALKPYLPFPVALLLSLFQMPGHGLESIQSMLRIARGMKKPSAPNVASWLTGMGITPRLQTDMIEPLCLGAMNVPMDLADSETFARVLREAFANHQSARLGWFNRPLTQALIEPIEQKLERLGVLIFKSTTIRRIEQHEHYCMLHGGGNGATRYAKAVIALPAYARNRLLDIRDEVQTEAITNVHLWFKEPVSLPQPLIGMIGTYSQWFFDVSAQMGRGEYSHICAVISAESPGDRGHTLQQVMQDLGSMLKVELPSLVYSKIVCEQRATVLTNRSNQHFSDGTLLDASEAPCSGELPSTIESAVLRGEKAARIIFSQPFS